MMERVRIQHRLTPIGAAMAGADVYDPFKALSADSIWTPKDACARNGRHVGAIIAPLRVHIVPVNAHKGRYRTVRTVSEPGSNPGSGTGSVSRRLQGEHGGAERTRGHRVGANSEGFS